MKRWGGGMGVGVWFWGRFGLKTGMDFVHFGLDRVWFSKELRKCMNLFFISVPNE